MRYYILLIAVLVLIGGALYVNIPKEPEFGAEIFAKEGFENGDKGAFDGEEVWDATLSYDGTSKIDGTYTLKCVASQESGCAVKEDFVGGQYETLFVKAKVHLPSGWDWTGADDDESFGIVEGYDSSDNELLSLYLEDAGSSVLELASWDSTNSTYRPTGLNPVTNSTFTVQVKFVMKSSGGRVVVWLDNDTEGSPDYDSGSTDVGDVDIDYILFGAYYSPGSYDAVYFDSVEVSTTFIEGDAPPAEEAPSRPEIIIID